MSVGFPLSKAELDTRVGGLVVEVRDALYRCKEINDLLNDTSIVPNDAFLTGLGYTSAEVTTLRAAFTDLNTLYLVAHGQQATGASDFFFNAKHLTGDIPT